MSTPKCTRSCKWFNLLNTSNTLQTFFTFFGVLSSPSGNLYAKSMEQVTAFWEVQHVDMLQHDLETRLFFCSLLALRHAPLVQPDPFVPTDRPSTTSWSVEAAHLAARGSVCHIAGRCGIVCRDDFRRWLWQYEGDHHKIPVSLFSILHDVATENYVVITRLLLYFHLFAMVCRCW